MSFCTKLNAESLLWITDSFHSQICNLLGIFLFILFLVIFSSELSLQSRIVSSKVLFDFITARSLNQEFFFLFPVNFVDTQILISTYWIQESLYRKLFSTWSQFLFWTILIKLLGQHNISWSVQLSSTINMWQFKNSVQCLEIKKSSKNFCKVCIN